MKPLHHLPALWLITCSFSLLNITVCSQEQPQKQEDFRFVFLTDIHLQPENNAVAGFSRAIDSVNALNPDFVITGGDLVMDAMGQRYSRADSLYDLYMEVCGKFRMPVHNTMGNHEIYGLYKNSGTTADHPEYGEKMYEKRLGRSFYAFTHKGWKFFIINSPESTGKEGYIGLVDPVQMAWLKEELAQTDPTVPIVVSTHIPLITAYTQKYDASTKPNDSSLVVVNAREVLGLFKGHNLRLVLQGHLHTVEEINIDGIRFITGGAVSAGWWRGPHRGFEEGFLLVSVSRAGFTWRYVDYGWEVR